MVMISMVYDYPWLDLEYYHDLNIMYYYHDYTKMCVRNRFILPLTSHNYSSEKTVLVSTYLTGHIQWSLI